eukprot:2698698-Karenia_brevis.AAC.1
MVGWTTSGRAEVSPPWMHLRSALGQPYEWHSSGLTHTNSPGPKNSSAAQGAKSTFIVASN